MEARTIDILANELAWIQAEYLSFKQFDVSHQWSTHYINVFVTQPTRDRPYKSMYFLWHKMKLY